MILFIQVQHQLKIIAWPGSEADDQKSDQELERQSQTVECHLCMERAAAPPSLLILYTQKYVVQKEWTQPSPVATGKRASREMSNFPELSSALSQKNKNGFALEQFIFFLPVVLHASAPQFEQHQRVLLTNLNTPATIDLSHIQKAFRSQLQQHPRVWEIKLTVISSHSREVNRHNKVRLLRSAVPRRGILRNGYNFFFCVIMEE